MSEGIDEVTRPKKLADFVSDDKIRSYIDTTIKATKLRGKSFPHTLITGPSGCGKTTIANIIANELGVNIKTLMGQSISDPEDIADAFVDMNDGDILFIDEFHEVPKRCQEVCYTAMEQGWVPKKFDSIIYNYKIKNVVVMAATNESSDLPSPFVSRCKFKINLYEYADNKMADIIFKNISLLSNITITESAALTFARVCRGVPRVANGNLEVLIDYALVNGITNVGDLEVNEIISYMSVDEYGLTEVDRKIMFALYRTKKLSIASLSSLVGQSEEILKKQYEPYLLKKGYMMRSSGGRRLTPDGWLLIADKKIQEV